MPLPQAQAASAAPLQIDLHLDDPAKRILFGVPEGAASDPNLANPFYHATELDRAGKHGKAEELYLDLLNQYFDNVVLHAALGMNYATTGKSGLGHRLLRYALENADRIFDDFVALGVEPRFTTPADRPKFETLKRSEILNAIGTCFKNENITDRAREHFEAAQALVPPNADIQNNLGTLSINEGNPAESLRVLDGALAISPQHPQAHWNRSLALLELGRFREAWPEYDWGFAAKVRADRTFTREPLPQWDGSLGKSVIVFGEQGIGDELLFLSCLPDLIRDSKLVVLDCHKKLHRLLANSFPSIPIYPTREDMHITWPVLPDGQTYRYAFDAKVSAGSLPRYYRNELADFPGTPFLKATPEVAARWAERLQKLPRRPNIGISWEGGHKRTRREVRSIPLAHLEPIMRNRDVNWISLQYTPVEAEVDAFTKATGIPVHHWPEAVYSADYNDTAGLVANLDLVISVATSVIHLAGGLGTPTWVLTASRAAWREYYGGDSNPWYQSLTMFRQAHGSVDWQPVITEVAEALTETLAALPAKVAA